jgi:hypothetical protein
MVRVSAPLIPVYLNQRIVFDLTAMLEGGIATVTRIETAERSEKKSEGEISGSFGLASAFASLIKVDLGGHTKTIRSEGVDASRTEDRVHTPASLLHMLRDRLDEKSLITNLGNNANPQPGQIVQFETSIRRNPVTHLLGTFNQLIDLYATFGGDSRVPSQKKGGGSSGEIKKMKNQIDGLLHHLEEGLTVDVISDEISDGWKAIITLERGFLNDPRMSDLTDGQFKVLGKVIRVVNSHTDSISLLRNTSLSSFREQLLSQMMSKLAEIGDTGNFMVPNMEWDLSGPVFQVIPIAIYA